MHRFLFYTLILACLLGAVPAQAQETADELDSLIEELENAVMYLALHEQLGPQEIDALRAELAEVHARVSALRAELYGAPLPAPAEVLPEARPPSMIVESPREELPGPIAPPAAAETAPSAAPPADLPPAPDKDGGGWTYYGQVIRNIAPDNFVFDGWKKDARIDVGWGDYGEITIDIANGDLRANWLVRNAYDGNDVELNVASGPDGMILIQVLDEQGRHDLLLTGGGAGELWRRETRGDGTALSSAGFTPTPLATAPAADDAEADPGTTAEDPPPNVASGERVVWEAAYLDAVANGTLERYPAMDWLIGQTASASYATPAIGLLGRFLNGDRSAPRSGSIGELTYLVGDAPRVVQFPDPRSDVTEFINFANKLYILTQSETDYEIFLYY